MLQMISKVQYLTNGLKVPIATKSYLMGSKWAPKRARNGLENGLKMFQWQQKFLWNHKFQWQQCSNGNKSSNGNQKFQWQQKFQWKQRFQWQQKFQLFQWQPKD